MSASLDFAELAAQRLERMLNPPETAAPKYRTPGDLARKIQPKTKQTKALDVIDAALMELINTPDGRLLISMPPQEGKSTRAAETFPLWVLLQRPDTRIALVSYSASLARRNGRAVRSHVETWGEELGLTLRDDVRAQAEWQLDGSAGSVYSVGVGGSLTGRPVDLMIIDDPLKDMKDADSALIRENVWDWWTSTGSTRLAPGAPVVVIQTRWHEDDLTGKLQAAEDGHLWKVINIPAQADHRPERGETDPLGRKPGEYLASARGRTTTQWEAIKKRVGPRVWAALYQGRPAPVSGGIFPVSDEWARYEQPIWIEREGVCTVPGMGRAEYEMAQSWDLTFKDTAGSDFVVGQVWLRIGTKAYLLDQVRRRMNFNETVRAIEAMSAKWPQAYQKFIEDKANGPAVINSLTGRLGGLIPIEPEGSKYARASAVSPSIWSKDVVLPSATLLPSSEELLVEAAGFPNGAHDDMVDAMSQAINRLLLMPLLLPGEGIVHPEEYDVYDEQGYSISPY